VVSQSGCDRQILPDESHRRRDYVEIPHLSGLGTFRSGLQSGGPSPESHNREVGYFQIRPTERLASPESPNRKVGVLSDPTCHYGEGWPSRRPHPFGWGILGALAAFCCRSDLEAPHPSGWGIREGLVHHNHTDGPLV
jgi:hypothetical protein